MITLEEPQSSAIHLQLPGAQKPGAVKPQNSIEIMVMVVMRTQRAR